MTASTLRSYTCKDLAQMARSEGVPGWHAMRKDELVSALVRTARRKRSKQKARSSTPTRKASATRADGAKPRVSPARKRIKAQISDLQQRQSQLKNVGGTSSNDSASDRLVVLVRDPYWLHVFWELSASSIERAKSALGQHWHAARPVLRLFHVEADGHAEAHREIVIHGGVQNWYVDVHEPPRSYRLEIGYQAPGEGFYCLARSNTVTTPAPGSAETVDKNWSDVADNADRIFAMSGGYSADGASLELQELLEERLRRRLGRPAQTRFGHGAAGMQRTSELRLAIDAELVVYGSTDPNTHVTVKGEPVAVRPDGTFAVKMHLPDRRQVVPVVAGLNDGSEQKTVILGVERNTKVLDPVVREPAS